MKRFFCTVLRFKLEKHDGQLTFFVTLESGTFQLFFKHSRPTTACHLKPLVQLLLFALLVGLLINKRAKSGSAPTVNQYVPIQRPCFQSLLPVQIISSTKKQEFVHSSCHRLVNTNLIRHTNKYTFRTYSQSSRLYNMSHGHLLYEIFTR